MRLPWEVNVGREKRTFKVWEHWETPVFGFEKRRNIQQRRLRRSGQ